MRRCSHTDTVHTSSALRVAKAGLDGGESERPFRSLLAAQCCSKGSHLFMHTRQGSGCTSALVPNIQSEALALRSTPCACKCVHTSVGAALAGYSPIGSPRAVPVPCTATADTCCAKVDAAAIAARTTAVCAGPLGAVRPLERPSWLTADACIVWSQISITAALSDTPGQQEREHSTCSTAMP